MSNPCEAGWGSVQFGGSPFGDGDSFPPTYPPYDVFCFGPCGSLSTIEFYRETTVLPVGQWYYDVANDSLRLVSGEDVSHQLLAKFEVDTAIPDEFTVEWKIRFDLLPTDFSQIDRYVHLGAGSQQGLAAGLMFSAVGVAFVPCPEEALVVTPLPSSAGLVSPGSVYIVRMVVDRVSTQICITEYSEYVLFGNKLRFVVPSVESSTCTGLASDKAWVFVQGVAGSTVCDVRVSSFCLSSQILTAPYPPIADAGQDQAAQFCSVILLDGSNSYSPGGLSLTYRWRLIDAPTDSGYVIDGLNGWTQPLLTPIGYTNKLYSNNLSELAVGDIRPGDVLLVDGASYDIVALGNDGVDYIEITEVVLPDQLSLRSFKVLRQFGFLSRDVVKPSFYPDTIGFFKFGLRVYDGESWSPQSVTVASIVSQVIPRGLTPSMDFIWDYLSDFWKLVDDKQRYGIIWSGMAQFLAAELLNLWQYEYAKSLRDIQRTFQRRWLSYSLQYTPAYAPMTLRTVLSPYDSTVFLTAGVTDLVDAQVTFLFPNGVSGVVTFHAAGGSSTLSAAEIVRQLQVAMPVGFTVTAVAVSPTESFIRMVCTYPFSVTKSTASIMPTATVTTELGGSAGTVIWDGRALRIDDEMHLTALGLKENDFLDFNGSLYRIIKVQSSGAGKVDDLIVVKDTLPLLGMGSWKVPSYVTQPNADFYGQLVMPGDDVFVQVRDGYGNSAYYQVAAGGVSREDQTVLAVRVDTLAIFLFYGGLYGMDLASVLRRKYVPTDPLVVDIPYLQAIITGVSEGGVLRRNMDFYLESYRDKRAIRFDEKVWQHELEGGAFEADQFPPPVLWAEVTYIDNRPVVEANFGKAVNFTLEDLAVLPKTVDYLSAVQGLWFSYFKGPRLGLLRAGAQILLGLPFAEEAGTIVELKTDYSPTRGRMLIQDSKTAATVRSYTFPVALKLDTNPATGKPYVLGDAVKQFAPLVAGVELLDYVSDKKWLDNYAYEGLGSTLQRFFRFLVRVDYGAFNLAAFMFARDFILKVKPTYTHPIFSVLLTADDTSIDITDVVDIVAHFGVFDTPCTVNVAAMWDQPEDGHESYPKSPAVGPMGSCWKNSYDCGYGAIRGTVDWGHDRIIGRQIE